MGRLGSQAVYASPVQSPARTQDSLPVVGQTLPGGLEGPLGSSERFRVVSYISPPSPGLPWRKRASVRHPAGEETEARNSPDPFPFRGSAVTPGDSGNSPSYPGHLLFNRPNRRPQPKRAPTKNPNNTPSHELTEALWDPAAGSLA